MDALKVDESIRTAESVRETINQDGAVLLDIKQGLCFSMNPVGARIWEMLKQKCSVEEIARSLEKEFQVSRSQIEADIAEFIENLKTRKLISVANDAGGAAKQGWLLRIFAWRSH
jgi:hypothetical protein